MSNISKKIREYVKCPQFDGGTEYGEWGALRLDQRKMIKELCEECEIQEKFADAYFKETQSLIHQLAEKDKEIEELKADLKSQKLVTDVYSTIAGSNATKMSIAKQIRHQVCEEIREKLKKCFTPACGTYIVYYEAKNVEDALDQIQGK